MGGQKQITGCYFIDVLRLLCSVVVARLPLLRQFVSASPPLSGRILGTFGAPNPSLTHPFVWLSHKKIDVLKSRWSKQTDNGITCQETQSNSSSLNNQLTNGFESTICQKWPDLVPRLLSAAQVQPVNGRVSGKYASVTQSSARTAGKLGVWLSADNICVIDVSDNGSRGQE